MEHTPSAAAGMVSEAMRQRIGVLTRNLHDALRELGYDRELQHARAHLPETRDRLEYVNRVTGEAADKVLDAVDSARDVQQALGTQARSLAQRWSSAGDTSGLVTETRVFCERVGSDSQRTGEILTEIMLAQDFHDRTGQVIHRVLDAAQELEAKLVKLLIDTAPPGEAPPAPAQPASNHAAPSGPVVKPEGRSDVVTSQAQVDDLLAQLGF